MNSERRGREHLNVVLRERRLTLPYLSVETNRFGKVVHYARAHRMRIRLRAEFGTIEYMREYAAALVELLGPPQFKEKATPEREPTKRIRRDTGFVYFVRSGSYIKIGFARDVERRVKDLQCSTAHRLEIIHTIPGTQSDEAAFHKRFKHYRRNGEWFALKGELADYLSEFNMWIEVL